MLLVSLVNMPLECLDSISRYVYIASVEMPLTHEVYSTVPPLALT